MAQLEYEDLKSFAIKDRKLQLKRKTDKLGAKEGTLEGINGENIIL